MSTLFSAMLDYKIKEIKEFYYAHKNELTICIEFVLKNLIVITFVQLFIEGIKLFIEGIKLFIINMNNLL